MARARAVGRVFGTRVGAVLWGACFGACAGGGAGVWRGRKRCCGARVLARARAVERVFGAGGIGAVGRVFWRVCRRGSGCLARAGAVLWGACLGACAGDGAGVWRGRERCCGARVLARAWAVGQVFGAGGSGAVGRVFWRVCWLWSGCLAMAEAVLWGACFNACAGCGAGFGAGGSGAGGRMFWRMCRRCSGCLARAGAVLWRVFWRVRGLWGGCLAHGWERCCGARVLARV